MKYINSLSPNVYAYLDFSFRRMVEGAVCVNKDELLDTLLDCQAGQALAAFSLENGVFG